jgi:hypothetical protein
MPTPVDHGHNKHTLYMRDSPLGVECTRCQRRALAFADEFETFKGNMTALKSLRFRCSGCGSRTWEGWVFHSAEEAKLWHERRLVVSPVGGGGPTF